MAQAYLYLLEHLVELNLQDGIPRVNINMSNNKSIVIYKGVQNHIDFSIRNSDRKPIKLLDKAMTAYVRISDTGELVLKKDLIIIDEYKGLARLVFTQGEMADMEDGRYTYGVIYKTEDEREGVLYSDRSADAIGEFKLESSVVPDARKSHVITEFLEESRHPGILHSDRIPGAHLENYVNSLHSYAIYSTGFTGTVTIQGSLDSGPTDVEQSWFTIDERKLTYIGNTAPIDEISPMPEVQGTFENITTDQNVSGVGGTSKYFDAWVRGNTPLTPKPNQELRIFQNGMHIKIEPSEVLILEMKTDVNNEFMTKYRFPQRFGNHFKNSNPTMYQLGLPIINDEVQGDLVYGNFEINPTWIRVKIEYASPLHKTGSVEKIVIRN